MFNLLRHRAKSYRNLIDEVECLLRVPNTCTPRVATLS